MSINGQLDLAGNAVQIPARPMTTEEAAAAFGNAAAAALALFDGHAFQQLAGQLHLPTDQEAN